MSRVVLATVVVQIVALGLLFALHAAAGRALGPAEYSVFAVSLSFAFIGSELSTLGWSRSITRFLADAKSAGDTDRYSLTIRQAIFQTRASSLLLAAALAVAFLITERIPLLGAASLVYFLSIQAVRKKVFLQDDLPFWALVPTDIALPIALVVAMFVLRIRTGFGALAGYLVIVAVAHTAASRRLRRISKPTRSDSLSDLVNATSLKTSLIVLIGVTAQMILLRADVIFLDFVASAEETGIYAAAARFARLPSVFQALITLAFLPRVALAFASGATHEFRRLVMISSGLSIVLNLPVFVACFVGASQLSELFGSGFSDSAPLLRTLAVGHFAVGMTGPTASYLIVTRHERAYSFPALAGTTATILLMYPVFSVWGSLGVAVLVASAISSINAAQALLFFVLNRNSLRGARS